MLLSDIENNYGNFFQNGEYSDGTPVLYKFCFYHYDSENGDDFAVFKQDRDGAKYCVGHNVTMDFEKFTCGWCWGHYDFDTYEEAKNFCLNYHNR